MKKRVPKPEQVLEVIKTLEEAKERYYPKLDIMQFNVHHTCGTPHCVGGAYALVKCDDATYWRDGAKQMAIDLGFQKIAYLQKWLGENPEFWGNDEGCSLFL